MPSIEVDKMGVTGVEALAQALNNDTFGQKHLGELLEKAVKDISHS